MPRVEVFYGSTYSNKHPTELTWKVLVELARAIVRFDEEHKGYNCDMVRVDVDKSSTKADYNDANKSVDMNNVTLELTMPANLVRPALLRAGVELKDDPMGDDQTTRFGLLELE